MSHLYDEIKYITQIAQKMREVKVVVYGFYNINRSIHEGYVP